LGGACATLSEVRIHGAIASADTSASLSKAFFRAVSICKILDKIPSLELRRQVAVLLALAKRTFSITSAGDYLHIAAGLWWREPR
jgi:hypothetical protein